MEARERSKVKVTGELANALPLLSTVTVTVAGPSLFGVVVHVIYEFIGRIGVLFLFIYDITII